MWYIWSMFVAMGVISGVSHLLCRRFWSGVGWSVVLFGWLHSFFERGGIPYYPSNPGAVPIPALAVTLLASAGLALACALLMPRWRRAVFWLPAIGLVFVYVALGDWWYRCWLEMALMMYTPIGTAVGTGLAAVRRDWRNVMWGAVLTVVLAFLALPQFDAQFHMIFQRSQ